MKSIHKLLLVLFLAGTATATNSQAQETPDGTPTPAPEKVQLTTIVNEKFDRHDVGSKSWSSSYHGCVVISILGAALAALLSKLGTPTDQKKRDNLIAILAAAAALATTLNTTLNFNQKWVANRTTRAALDKLRIEMTSSTVNLDDIRKRLNDALTRHEEMLTKP